MGMSFNTKLEIAVEVISAKIADASRKGLTTEDEEMKTLLKERIEMYSGNEEIIDKIINVYGPELKNEFES